MGFAARRFLLDNGVDFLHDPSHTKRKCCGGHTALRHVCIRHVGIRVRTYTEYSVYGSIFHGGNVVIESLLDKNTFIISKKSIIETKNCNKIQ